MFLLRRSQISANRNVLTKSRTGICARRAINRRESINEKTIGFLAFRNNLAYAFASVDTAQTPLGYLLGEMVAMLPPDCTQCLEVVSEEAFHC
mmetsp:Transcript_11412/g.23969  ORF Transcript_11412/g.23969 Transcript_11412/m.23969 type:complete len:93 (+) Transcript_11412:44-322(+)